MPQRTPDTIFPADPGAYGPASCDELARRLGSARARPRRRPRSRRPRRVATSWTRWPADLAALPGVLSAFVGVLQDTDGRRVRTLARYRGPRREDDVVFQVDGTAACQVVRSQVCVLASASRHVPGRADCVAESGGSGFLGAPLLARDGTVIGLIGVDADSDTPRTRCWTRCSCSPGAPRSSSSGCSRTASRRRSTTGSRSCWSGVPRSWAPCAQRGPGRARSAASRRRALLAFGARGREGTMPEDLQPGPGAGLDEELAQEPRPLWVRVAIALPRGRGAPVPRAVGGSGSSCRRSTLH